MNKKQAYNARYLQLIKTYKPIENQCFMKKNIFAIYKTYTFAYIFCLNINVSRFSITNNIRQYVTRFLVNKELKKHKNS